MVARRPGLIARCTDDVADVQAVGPGLCWRQVFGPGRDVAAATVLQDLSTWEGGVVIDLTKMRLDHGRSC